MNEYNLENFAQMKYFAMLLALPFYSIFMPKKQMQICAG